MEHQYHSAAMGECEEMLKSKRVNEAAELMQ
jgi:hypothetical protein